MWSLVFLCLIILLALIVLRKKVERFTEQIPGKTIWLRSDAMAESWRMYNPDWQIEITQRDKIELLMEHGGVWADADVGCAAPLDDWIYDAIESTGFWMYHDSNYGEEPATWFIVSMKGAIKDYKKRWHEVPYLWSHARGPYVYRGLPAKSAQRHELLYESPVPLPFKTQRVLVVADCGLADEIETLKELSNEYRFEMLVYDKCNFGKHVKGVYCRPLKNVGRDAETLLRFIVKYYDNFPREFFFIPSNIKKWDRIGKFRNLIESDTTPCDSSELDLNGPFELPEYLGQQLIRADTYPFKAWFEKYVGPWDPRALAPCWNIFLKTTRERVHRRPRHYYANLLGQVNYGEPLETVHFIERSIGYVL